MAYTIDQNGKNVELTYETLSDPYDSFLSRTENGGSSDSISVSGGSSSSSENESSEGVITSGQEIADLFLSNIMRSSNYLPKVRGFKIDAQAGAIEAASLTLTGGSISYQKTSFTDLIHAGYYIGPEGIYFGGASDATKLKFNISTGSLEYAGNLINGSGDIVLNSTAQTILKDFSFGTVDYAGAVRTGDIAWNGSGVVTSGTGVAIYRGGIVGSSAGVVTFAIDATTGDASFSGTITGSTITGGTIRTSASGERIRITSAVASTPTQPANSMAFIDSNDNIIVGIGTEVFASSTVGIATRGNITGLSLGQLASSTLVALSITTHTSSVGGCLEITENGSGLPLGIVQSDTSNTNAVLSLTQNSVTETNFKFLMNIGTISIFQNDGTSPDGKLTGQRGDFCYDTTGKAWWCDTNGTNWTQYL